MKRTHKKNFLLAQEREKEKKKKKGDFFQEGREYSLKRDHSVKRYIFTEEKADLTSLTESSLPCTPGTVYKLGRNEQESTSNLHRLLRESRIHRREPDFHGFMSDKIFPHPTLEATSRKLKLKGTMFDFASQTGGITRGMFGLVEDTAKSDPDGIALLDSQTLVVALFIEREYGLVERSLEFSYCFGDEAIKLIGLIGIQSGHPCVVIPCGRFLLYFAHETILRSFLSQKITRNLPWTKSIFLRKAKLSIQNKEPLEEWFDLSRIDDCMLFDGPWKYNSRDLSSLTAWITCVQPFLMDISDGGVYRSLVRMMVHGFFQSGTFRGNSFKKLSQMLVSFGSSLYQEEAKFPLDVERMRWAFLDILKEETDSSYTEVQDLIKANHEELTEAFRSVSSSKGNFGSGNPKDSKQKAETGYADLVSEVTEEEKVRIRLIEEASMDDLRKMKSQPWTNETISIQRANAGIELGRQDGGVGQLISSILKKTYPETGGSLNHDRILEFMMNPVPEGVLMDTLIAELSNVMIVRAKHSGDCKKHSFMACLDKLKHGDVEGFKKVYEFFNPDSENYCSYQCPHRIICKEHSCTHPGHTFAVFKNLVTGASPGGRRMGLYDSFYAVVASFFSGLLKTFTDQMEEQKLVNSQQTDEARQEALEQWAEEYFKTKKGSELKRILDLCFADLSNASDVMPDSFLDLFLYKLCKSYRGGGKVESRADVMFIAWYLSGRQSIFISPSAPPFPRMTNTERKRFSSEEELRALSTHEILDDNLLLGSLMVEKESPVIKLPFDVNPEVRNRAVQEALILVGKELCEPGNEFMLHLPGLSIPNLKLFFNQLFSTQGVSFLGLPMGCGKTVFAILVLVKIFKKLGIRVVVTAPMRVLISDLFELSKRNLLNNEERRCVEYEMERVIDDKGGPYTPKPEPLSLMKGGRKQEGGMKQCVARPSEVTMCTSSFVERAMEEKSKKSSFVPPVNYPHYEEENIRATNCKRVVTPMYNAMKSRMRNEKVSEEDRKAAEEYVTSADCYWNEWRTQDGPKDSRGDHIKLIFSGISLLISDETKADANLVDWLRTDARLALLGASDIDEIHDVMKMMRPGSGPPILTEPHYAVEKHKMTVKTTDDIKNVFALHKRVPKMARRDEPNIIMVGTTSIREAIEVRRVLSEEFKEGWEIDTQLDIQAQMDSHRLQRLTKKDPPFLIVDLTGISLPEAMQKVLRYKIDLIVVGTLLKKGVDYNVVGGAVAPDLIRVKDPKTGAKFMLRVIEREAMGALRQVEARIGRMLFVEERNGKNVLIKDVVELEFPCFKDILKDSVVLKGVRPLSSFEEEIMGKRDSPIHPPKIERNLDLVLSLLTPVPMAGIASSESRKLATVMLREVLSLFGGGGEPSRVKEIFISAAYYLLYNHISSMPPFRDQEVQMAIKTAKETPFFCPEEMWRVWMYLTDNSYVSEIVEDLSRAMNIVLREVDEKELTNVDWRDELRGSYLCLQGRVTPDNLDRVEEYWLCYMLDLHPDRIRMKGLTPMGLSNSKEYGNPLHSSLPLSKLMGDQIGDFEAIYSLSYNRRPDGVQTISFAFTLNKVDAKKRLKMFDQVLNVTFHVCREVGYSGVVMTKERGQHVLKQVNAQTGEISDEIENTRPPYVPYSFLLRLTQQIPLWASKLPRQMRGLRRPNRHNAGAHNTRSVLDFTCSFTRSKAAWLSKNRRKVFDLSWVKDQKSQFHPEIWKVIERACTTEDIWPSKGIEATFRDDKWITGYHEGDDLPAWLPSVVYLLLIGKISGGKTGFLHTELRKGHKVSLSGQFVGAFMTVSGELSSRSGSVILTFSSENQSCKPNQFSSGYWGSPFICPGNFEEDKTPGILDIPNFALKYPGLEAATKDQKDLISRYVEDRCLKFRIFHDKLVSMMHQSNERPLNLSRFFGPPGREMKEITHQDYIDLCKRSGLFSSFGSSVKGRYKRLTLEESLEKLSLAAGVARGKKIDFESLQELRKRKVSVRYLEGLTDLVDRRRAVVQNYPMQMVQGKMCYDVNG